MTEMVVSRSIRAGFSWFNPGRIKTPTTNGVPARCTHTQPGYFKPGTHNISHNPWRSHQGTLALPGYFKPASHNNSHNPWSSHQVHPYPTRLLQTRDIRPRPHDKEFPCQ